MLFHELAKIARQISGSQNLFGYQSTVANQLFLFYCIIGKIYFTDKVNSQVKCLWYVLVSCMLSISFAVSVAFFWSGVKNDLVMMLNLANVIGGINTAVFGFPLISYIYGTDIEAMIDHVDRILAPKFSCGRRKQKQVVKKAKKVFLSIMAPSVICTAIYAFACFFDVVLFFEEDKVKNYLYYALPIPLVQEYGSFGSFFLINGILTFVALLFMLKWYSLLIIILYWSTICRNELMCMCKEFNSRSFELNWFVERGGRTWKNWNREFESFSQHGTKQFQDIIRLIDYLKPFVEITGSFVIPVGFLYGIAVLYICSSNDLLLVLKLKFSTSYVAVALSIFQYYWIGEKLDNSISDVSSAIYSTPWYWSTEVRKNIHLMLCQTQTVKIFSIIKVYGLLLRNFSGYLSAVMTYTNVLRQLTSKNDEMN